MRTPTKWFIALAVALVPVSLVAYEFYAHSRMQSEMRALQDLTQNIKEQTCKADAHCDWKPHWEETVSLVNAIDGTRRKLIETESTDADGILGDRLEYAVLALCFDDGKLCRSPAVGIGITVDGIVDPLSYESEHTARIRLKFDDSKPVTKDWGISDSSETIFPFGAERTFATELLKHRTLILEFSYFERAPRTVTFELSGLAEKIKSMGIATF